MQWLVPWLPDYWPLVLLGVVPFVLFAPAETIAIKFGGETFSRWMADEANNKTFGKMWIMIWGLLLGSLITHFLGWCICTATITGQLVLPLVAN